MINVLVTRGKHDCVDYAKVVNFKGRTEAEEYCEQVADKTPTKYWTKAEVVESGEEVSLDKPDWS